MAKLTVIVPMLYHIPGSSLYGPEPVIYGLDTCVPFRESSDPADHFLGVAGTFNTGTNLLSELLIHNCHIPARMAKYGARNEGIRWQVRTYLLSLFVLISSGKEYHPYSFHICSIRPQHGGNIRRYMMNNFVKLTKRRKATTTYQQITYYPLLLSAIQPFGRLVCAGMNMRWSGHTPIRKQ